MWSYALAVIGITGLYLAGNKNRWGWALGIFAQILWAYYGIATHQYGFLISCLGYGFVYIRNFIRFGKDTDNASRHSDDRSAG